MHSSAEKIIKPKSHPTPRSKQGPPAKQPKTRRGGKSGCHRMRDTRRILPGAGIWTWRSSFSGNYIDGGEPKLSGTRTSTRGYWALNKVNYLLGKRPMLKHNGHSSVFLRSGRTGTRKFRKFARRHPVDALRMEQEERRRDQDMAEWKASGNPSYIDFAHQRRIKA